METQQKEANQGLLSVRGSTSEHGDQFIRLRELMDGVESVGEVVEANKVRRGILKGMVDDLDGTVEKEIEGMWDEIRKLGERQEKGT